MLESGNLKSVVQPCHGAELAISDKQPREQNSGMNRIVSLTTALIFLHLGRYDAFSKRHQVSAKQISVLGFQYLFPQRKIGGESTDYCYRECRQKTVELRLNTIHSYLGVIPIDLRGITSRYICIGFGYNPAFS